MALLSACDDISNLSSVGTTDSFGVLRYAQQGQNKKTKKKTKKKKGPLFWHDSNAIIGGFWIDINEEPTLSQSTDELVFLLTGFSRH